MLITFSDPISLPIKEEFPTFRDYSNANKVAQAAYCATYTPLFHESAVAACALLNLPIEKQVMGGMHVHVASNYIEQTLLLPSNPRPTEEVVRSLLSIRFVKEIVVVGDYDDSKGDYQYRKTYPETLASASGGSIVKDETPEPKKKE